MTAYGYVVLSLGALGIWAIAGALGDVRDKLTALLDLEYHREQVEEMRQAVPDYPPES